MVEIVVLAGGAGTRMHTSRPKVIHQLCGKPMLHWIVEESLKITPLVQVVVGHKRELVEESLTPYPIDIAVQDIENYPGSGGALMAARLRGDKILVLNGDIPLITADDLAPFLEVEGDVVVGVFDVPPPHSYGRIIRDREGYIVKIVEAKDCTPDQLQIATSNSGVYLFKREVVERLLPRITNNNAQREYYVTDLIELAYREGYKVVGVEVEEERFQGVNNLVELAAAETKLCRRIKEKWMREGVIIRLPETVYIDAYTTFKGECEVEPGAVIKRSKIVNSRIKAHSVVEEGEIIDSEIGPMARIRPGSKIVESRIGNFVEVKNSVLEGVKAGHLSYLGDSEIGEGTNIGAGTITCNYDGKRKYRTKIGKNVFVGSDVKLIAPVEIADEVILAAGSVINRDIPRGSLAIGRPPLRIVKNFFYRFFNSKKR